MTGSTLSAVTLRTSSAQRRLAGRQCPRGFLHEVVIDADIIEPATKGASSCADCCPEQRIEEHEALSTHPTYRRRQHQQLSC